MIEDKEDDVEELFGDECTLDCADAFVSFFQFLTPTLHPKEVLQWTSLWLCGGAASENAMSGMVSGEQKNWAYSLRVPWSPSMDSDSSLPPLPRLFRVLHRDSSQECVCHGEVGLFIHVEDPVALLPLEEAGDLPSYLIPLALGSYPNEKKTSSAEGEGGQATGPIDWRFHSSASEELVKQVLQQLMSEERTGDKVLGGGSLF